MMRQLDGLGHGIPNALKAGCWLRSHSASCRLGIRIDDREFLLADIVHRPIHRPDEKLTQLKQQGAIQEVLLREVQPPVWDSLLSERERHAIMIGRDELVGLVRKDRESDTPIALVLGLL